MMEPMCTHPMKQPFTSAIFFLVFTILTQMIIMNLFVGVVCGSMEVAHVSAQAEDEVAETYKFVPGRLELYHQLFDLLDTDGSGSVDLDELSQMVFKVLLPYSTSPDIALLRSDANK